MHTYTHTQICTLTHTHKYAHTHTRTQTSTHAHTYTYTHTNMYTHTRKHTQAHQDIHTETHTHTHTHAHTPTHTHTLSLAGCNGSELMTSWPEFSLQIPPHRQTLSFFHTHSHTHKPLSLAGCQTVLAYVSPSDCLSFPLFHSLMLFFSVFYPPHTLTHVHTHTHYLSYSESLSVLPLVPFLIQSIICVIHSFIYFLFVICGLGKMQD